MTVRPWPVPPSTWDWKHWNSTVKRKTWWCSQAVRDRPVRGRELSQQSWNFLIFAATAFLCGGYRMADSWLWKCVGVSVTDLPSLAFSQHAEHLLQPLWYFVALKSLFICLLLLSVKTDLVSDLSEAPSPGEAGQHKQSGRWFLLEVEISSWSIINAR